MGNILRPVLTTGRQAGHLIITNFILFCPDILPGLGVSACELVVHSANPCENQQQLYPPVLKHGCVETHQPHELAPYARDCWMDRLKKMVRKHKTGHE